MAGHRHRVRAGYDVSVFVNCPFDDEYQPLFRALVFAVTYCGFAVRCALEVDDSVETRAEKIIRLVRRSRYGIHDISRTESNAEGLPRFNMPYELGLFVGFRHGGGPGQGWKVALVLGREPYRFQKFLSDIAGQDIRSHGGLAGGVVRQVRNWLQNQTDRELYGADHISARFAAFLADVPQLLTDLKRSPADLDNYLDYYQLVFKWVQVDLSRPS